MKLYHAPVSARKPLLESQALQHERPVSMTPEASWGPLGQALSRHSHLHSADGETEAREARVRCAGGYVAGRWQGYLSQFCVTRHVPPARGEPREVPPIRPGCRALS